jgi:hypothetical protein
MPLPANLRAVGLSAVLAESAIPLPDFAAPASGTTAPAALARLKAIRALLASAGITDLSALGTLRLPSGNHLLQPGLLDPASAGTAGSAGEPVPFTGAGRLTRTADGKLLVSPLSGTASPLPARPLTAGLGRGQSPLPIFEALWVATAIDIPDNTTVILLPPGAMSLLIIAETITIGNNVQFTWSRPAIPPLNLNFPPGDAPPTPAQVPPPAYRRADRQHRNTRPGRGERGLGIGRIGRPERRGVGAQPDRRDPG